MAPSHPVDIMATNDSNDTFDTAGLSEFPCDLCGSDEADEIEICRDYTDGRPVHVCRGCGFVYVKHRRSAQEIAASWSDEIFEEIYTARIPLVRARQTYVADTIDTEIGLSGKTLCDVGGGEGQFLEIARDAPYSANVFAIEPSASNCTMLGELGIDSFQGTIEEYAASDEISERGGFDVVTIMWTLENCQDCRKMLEIAHSLTKDGGHVVVATGSRILVPFKKPLQLYLKPRDLDTHAFRWSANSLQQAMARSALRPVFVNRYVDTDWLVAIARKEPKGTEIPWEGDDPDAVKDFFTRWDAETRNHFADIRFED